MKHVNVKPQTACKSYTIFFFFFAGTSTAYLFPF